MKILIITGSGMKAGNTDQLSDAFMEGAKEAGHQVVKVFDRLYAVSKEDQLLW